MKYGILNVSDLNSSVSLFATDYLNNEDYMVCEECKRIQPVGKSLNKKFCCRICKAKIK